MADRRPVGRGRKVAVVAAFVVVATAATSVVISMYDDYGVTRAKVHESVGVTGAHRAALESACRSGSLRAGFMPRVSGGSDRTGTYTRSVRVEVDSDRIARVVATMRGFDSDVAEGATVVFAGECSHGRMSWTVGGTVPERHRPKAREVAAPVS